MKLWAKQHHGHAVGESLIGCQSLSLSRARARVSWAWLGLERTGLGTHNLPAPPRHFGPLDIPGSTPPLEARGPFHQMGPWDVGLGTWVFSWTLCQLTCCPIHTMPCPFHSMKNKDMDKAPASS